MTVTETTGSKELLISNLETQQSSFSAPERLKKQALGVLEKTDFPTTKHEEWKYTNIKSKLQENYKPNYSVALSKEEISTYRYCDSCDLLVFINGKFQPQLSEIATPQDGVFIGSLAEGYSAHPEIIEKHFGAYSPLDEEVFTALNTAYASNGAFIYIPSGQIIKESVQILFISLSDEPVFTQPRVLAVAEKGSNLTLVETYVSHDNQKAFSNAGVEIACGDNAVVEHYKLQLENEETTQVNTCVAHLSRSSVYSSFVLTLGGSMVRNNLTAVLDEPGAEANLFGLYLPHKHQHIDNHTLVDHRKPHCNSNELYKGIVDNFGNAVFNGKIFVRKDAQKTNAFQSNKNILLSDNANVDSKPQLEIYADDVKCSHGSSTGQFDEDALFYMNARGIGKDAARNLLMYAFASEIVDSVRNEDVQKYMHKLLSARLEHDFSE